MGNDSFVRILSHTPLPDKLCASSAKISTTVGSAADIYDSTADIDKNTRLIKRVILSGHKSIIEHIVFNIAFNNVSAYVEQFIIEFRLASFTVKSRRYVDFRGIGYNIPSFADTDEEIRGSYIAHMEYLFNEYKSFIDAGIPKEDARFLLPYSYRSNFYCTVNARELCNMLYSMIYGRGKDNPEIKRMGNSLLAQCVDISPYIFSELKNIEHGSEDKYTDVDNILQSYEVANKPGPRVELIHCPNDPDSIVAGSIIFNHNNAGTGHINKLLSNARLKQDLIDTVMKYRRKRELEQINFTFRINGISLAGITHITRHRIQSIIIPPYTNVFRYDKFIIPASLKTNDRLKQRYIEAFRKTFKLWRSFSSHGVNKHELSCLYLSGNAIDIITTMNARELLVFLSLRTCNRAQWEIRNIAVNMLSLLRDVSPCIFNHYGPRCFMEGKCPEGNLTCGKREQVIDSFKPGSANLFHHHFLP